MSTAAQKSANAANSRRSTGPRTEEGKQKASQNSARHYLTAKQLVIPGEDPQDYNQLHQELEQSWNPATAQESLLVHQIAQNAWRLMRVRRLETATFEAFMPSLDELPIEEPQPGQEQPTRMRAPETHDSALAQAFHNNAKAFDNLRRYATPIERAYHKAIAELTTLQKQRKNSEIGSVSQKPESGRMTAASAAYSAAAVTHSEPITEPFAPEAPAKTPAGKTP
jgi:hypothetical protein